MRRQRSNAASHAEQARHRPDPWLPRSDHQHDLDRCWQDWNQYALRDHTVTMSDQPHRNRGPSNNGTASAIAG